jgi:oligogalacturonide lyase
MMSSVYRKRRGWPLTPAGNGSALFPCRRSNSIAVAVCCSIVAVLPALVWAQAADQHSSSNPPESWVDPDTGHRVVRLTQQPGSASLYFNQNGYTGNGKEMVFTTAHGISVLDLATHAARPVVEGKVRVIVAGRKSQLVYYTKDGAVYSTDVDTRETRKIAQLPPRGSVDTVNADETLLAGTYIEGDTSQSGNKPYFRPRSSQQPQILDQPRNKGQMMEERLAAHLPMALFTINVKTGELKAIHRSTDWLNHLEFSPTDPTLLMFCHEGPWHKVDRIWTIRTDGTQITKVHTRTIQMEIAGHEFWSADGSTIWYDLQTPRSEDFWVAGYNVTSGARTWYHLQRNEWSIHFNVSRDGKLFAGDGGDPGQVAHASDGRWIYLFRPELIQNRGDDRPGLIHPGVFHAERLVNMSRHEYHLEPNVSFTPDGKWVVFRSNMFGPTYAFAVEVAKAKGGSTATN